MEKQFNALVVDETNDGSLARAIKTRTVADLPPGEVTVRVKYSSLNYKDALSATGNKGVTRRYPHTPGIDAAGTVEKSGVPELEPGQQVIVSGYDLGMNTPGGLGQMIRVPANWVVKLPAGLSLRESMILGTAGFTAAMSVDKVAASVSPDDGDILVTGATGGVGSIAIALLAKLGYTITAVSGKEAAWDFLKSLGAKEVMGRDAAIATGSRPMLKARWAGVVDTVGGEILTTAVKSTQSRGVVTCCGNVASAELPLSVYPFILRGVSLLGIDSQNCPLPQRAEIWNRLAGEWKLENLNDFCTEITLADLSHYIDLILEGKLKGRTLVNLEND